MKNEGWFDPWMLLNAFKTKVKSLGVKFLEADVTAVTVEDNEVKKIKVRTSYILTGPHVSIYVALFSGLEKFTRMEWIRTYS